jgi:hypothetical protein
VGQKEKLSMQKWSSLKPHCYIFTLATSLAVFMAGVAYCETTETYRLALLIAAPWKGETAMHHDIVAMTETLRSRGFSSEEILALEDSLNRQKLMSFLQNAHQRVAAWSSGEVFLYISGHGGFTGTTVASARPAVMLANTLSDDTEHWVFWDEVFAALVVPDHIQFILLPDT